MSSFRDGVVFVLLLIRCRHSVDLFCLLVVGKGVVGGGLLLIKTLMDTFLLTSYSNKSGDGTPIIDATSVRGTTRMVGCCGASLKILGSVIGRGSMGTMLSCVRRGKGTPTLSTVIPPTIISGSSTVILGPNGYFGRRAHRGLGRGCAKLFRTEARFCTGFSACLSCLGGGSMAGTGGLLSIGCRLDARVSRCGRGVFSVLDPFARRTRLMLLISGPLGTRVVSIQGVSSAVRDVLGLCTHGREVSNPHVSLGMTRLARRLSTTGGLPIIGNRRNRVGSCRTFLSRIRAFVGRIGGMERGKRCDSTSCSVLADTFRASVV